MRKFHLSETGSPKVLHALPSGGDDLQLQRLGDPLSQRWVELLLSLGGPPYPFQWSGTQVVIFGDSIQEAENVGQT